MSRFFDKILEAALRMQFTADKVALIEAAAAARVAEIRAESGARISEAYHQAGIAEQFASSAYWRAHLSTEVRDSGHDAWCERNCGCHEPGNYQSTDTW